MSELPRVLVFTEDCLNASHGTGALLMRYLDGYPQERLCNVYLRQRNEPAWPQAFEAPRLPMPRSSFPQPLSLGTRLWNLMVSRVLKRRWLPLVERPPVFLPVEQEFARLGFRPEVVFTSAFSLSGLKFAKHLRDQLPRSVPVVQQFFDYFGSTPLGFGAALRDAVSGCTKLWSVTSAIAADVQQRTGREVQVVPSLHMALPDIQKNRHVEAGPEFKAVTVGNFQSRDVLEAVKRVWSGCRREIHGLGPLRWLAHEGAFKSLEPWLGEDIEWAGFFQGEKLLEVLTDADLCFVPVNSGTKACDDFARYSLPTRVTEPLAAGLPVCAMASADTALSMYLNEHEVGATMTSSETRVLIDLIRERSRRERLSQAGCAHARTHFGIENHRAWFISQLSSCRSS